MADPPTLPPAPRRIEWRLDDLDLERAGRWSLVASGVAMAGCVVLAFRHLQAGAVDWSTPGVALGVTLARRARPLPGEAGAPIAAARGIETAHSR